MRRWKRRRRKKIDSRKTKALAALLAYPTQEQAAQAAGIAPRTLRGYLQDKEFTKEYEQRRAQLVASATAQLQQSLSSAICALRSVVESEKSSDNAKIIAARVLLDHGLKYSELYDLLCRLEKIESVVREAEI